MLDLYEKLNHSLFYLRTNHGLEIDLIIDKKQSKEYIEIKQSATFTSKMIRHLQTIQALDTDKNNTYSLLYNGQARDYKGIHVRPYWQEWC